MLDRRDLLRLLTAVVWSAGATAAGARPKREVVPVPDWASFDGARWGALVLGETTLGAFNERYSSRDTDTPGLLQATTPNRSSTRVYLVFSGAAPEARLEWVTTFREEGKRPAPEALLQQYGSDYTERFPEGRTLDWRLWIFPARGAAAVLDRQPRGEEERPDNRASGFIYARPALMKTLAERLPPEETLLQPPDEKDRSPLEAAVGTISVSSSRDGDVSFDRDRLETEVSRRVRYMLDRPGPVSYDRGEDGRASVTVRVRRRPDKGGKRRVAIEVSQSITAEGPYGTVNGSGSASLEIEDDITSGRIREEAVDGTIEATEEAVDSLYQSMQRQRTEAYQARARGQMLELAKLLLRTGRKGT